MASHPDEVLVRAALSKEPAAVRELVRRLTPVVQARVARILLRANTRSPAAVRQEVEDVSQDVFLALFAGEGKTLLSWNPEFGASLESFVALVGERLAISILRSRRRNPFQLQLQDPADMADSHVSQGNAHGRLEARQSVTLVAERLRTQLSEEGLEMFYRLFLWEESIEEVCTHTGFSAASVYQWRSRLKRLVQELVTEESPPVPPLAGGSRGTERRAPALHRSAAKEVEPRD